MKRLFMSTALCVTTAALASTGALAQGQSQNASTASSQQSGSLEQANAQEFFRASDLIGRTAQDTQGKEIGDIKDVSFNQQGEIFAFVDVGNGKWAAVPWQVVNSG